MGINAFPEPIGPCEADQRHARIYSLAQTLRGAQLAPEVDPKEPQLTLPGGITVMCERRASDDGRLWYTIPPGDPVAEADDRHLMDAVVAIRCRLISRPAQTLLEAEGQERAR